VIGAIIVTCDERDLISFVAVVSFFNSMAVESFDGGTVISGDDIHVYRMKVLLRALALEIKGMKISKGQSAYSVIKNQFNLKGSKQKVFDQFQQIVNG
jgi:hypothetical protein